MQGRILLSDNSITLSESIRFALSRNGYEVDTAWNEEQTISMIKTGKYRLVIVDLKDMDTFGASVINFITGREVDSSVPAILALSQPAEQEEISGIVSGGIKEWLMIPFSNEKLLNSVKKILG
ncbi:MAG: hypothetical protein DRP59_05205 [Spirochaetes bacterium]|nr:MAG: hypothetical protein DRP59_05205 [Spirochaetota bacterium]